MARLNCWEFKRCGKEYGGKAARNGCCPASTHESAHGVNGGECAGRLCWTIASTLCRAADPGACDHCDFLAKVREEEGISLQLQEHEHSQAW